MLSQSSHFLSIISVTIALVAISLILFYNEYFKSKYLEENEKLNLKMEAYQIAKKLISCLGEEKEGIFYIDKNKLDDFSQKYAEIEPKCAIADSFDYNMKIIQFEKEIRNYPIQFSGGCGWAWVINSGGGKMHSSVSLVTSDGRELRRHYTSPDINGNPSRTAVDKSGNIWVGNRENNILVKIAFDKNLCKKNEGRIPEDTNRNDRIDESEMVSFNDDGCILAKIELEDCYKGGVGIRAVCIDSNESVYAGCWDSKKMYKISKEGKIEKNWTLPNSPYGCVVGNDEKIYITTIDSGKILILDPESGNVESIDVGGYTYGIWRCYNRDCIVFSTWENNGVILFNTTSKKVVWEKNCGNYARGVFVDNENNVYVVSSGSSVVCKFDFNGNPIKENIQTCLKPAGISMDSCGNVWIECLESGVDIFDKDLNKISNFIIPGEHYTYSDFTGFLSDIRVELSDIEERTIKIERKEWNFGLKNLEAIGSKTSIGPKISYETSISIPVVIKYSETFMTDGLLVMNIYKGFLESFYSFIDSVCNMELSEEFEISKVFYFDYDVKVYNDKICSENVCKKLVCSYEIAEKEFKKGENIVTIKLRNNKIEFI